MLKIVTVKTLVFLLAFLAGCTHAAMPLEDGQTPDRNDIVLTGEVSNGGSLELRAASGRVYAVRSQGSRFTVALPAGVYEVTSIDGVRPGVPLSFNGIPGDRLELGRFNVNTGTVSSGATMDVSRRAGYFGATSNETPLRYYTRTGERTRPMPVPAGWGGGSRAGQGLGLRSR